MSNEIESKIRFILIEAFEKCQSINYSKSEQEYFDLADEVMQKFKGITIAAMRAKLNNATTNK